uniref:glycoside hydrolase family 3 C-terminal domain-containing protein n=1 Tax=Roseburia sp. TaxID=2049040 RepID=UPI003FEF5CE8
MDKELKAQKKTLKKAYKKARRKSHGLWKFFTWFSAPIAIVIIMVMVVLSTFDNTVALFVGGTFWKLENEDPEAIYYENDFETEEERNAVGYELVKQVEAEGAALLMNANGALPLAEGSKVSLFSTSTVNLVYGGTGSANVDASKALDLRTACEMSGLSVNTTLWDFYKTGDGAQYVRNNGGFSGGETINEAPWSAYTDEVLASVEEYNDAAVVVLSRVGGEGADSEYQTANYLALDDTEREMLAELKNLKDAGKLKKIIVLLNTSNALQLDFLQNDAYGVDAVLWIGGVGIAGTDAVADILAGKTNPSGSLVDTYCYNNYSSLAMKNFTPVTYAGYEEGLIPENASTYMIYQEGIYVGYKYYETRYEDYVMGTGNAGEYAYGDDVAFAFGHGLSYTDFEYSDVSVSYDAAAGTYTMNVTVTNTGDLPGKETVQAYVSSPYTQYDIDNKVEKASVSLVGFAKTEILEPGTSETLAIEIDGDYVASYDAYGAKTYILDEGDYLFAAATDAHDAANNVLAAKGFTPENTDGRMDAEGNADLVAVWNNPELDTTTYAVSDNGTAITNQLEGADPNLNDAVEEEVVFTSRNDWMGTMPSDEALVLTLTDALKDALQDVQYDPADYEDVEMPTLGAKNGLTLYDMIGLDYDDPKWEELLDQLTFDEMVTLIGDSFHWTMPVKSIEAPGTRDENGPQGLTVTLFGAGLNVQTTALTSEDVLAATFNTDLVYKMGNIVGNDCLAANVPVLYGPGANTHRSPYGGRNFEYYSEDGVLASEIGEAEVRGIEEKGVHVVIKHFALNDCEQDRIGLGVWLTEQAAREIYLRAFQGALESSQAGGNGVMMAYTRWGTQWSGANAGLIKGILNEEWGCHGKQITDNVLTTYVNGVDGVMGGTTAFDSMLAFYIINNGNGQGRLPEYRNDPVVVTAMREAAHSDLYATANSSGMNGVGADTTIRLTKPIVITVVQILAFGFSALFIVSVALWILKYRKFKQNEAAVAYREFKKSLKKQA